MVCHVCYDASRKQVLERPKIFFGPKSSRTSSPVFSTSSRSFSQKFFFFSNFRIFCLVFGRFFGHFFKRAQLLNRLAHGVQFFFKTSGSTRATGWNRKKPEKTPGKPGKTGKTGKNIRQTTLNIDRRQKRHFRLL